MVLKVKEIIFGIDGGGTKSHMAIFDRSGQCIQTAIYGPLNHESMEGSYDQLEEELPRFIEETLARAGLAPSDIAYAVMGIAGVDTPKQHTIISAMIERTGLPRFLLCNDAYLGVPAGCPDGVGICAINGTGSTLAAVDYSGDTVQVGGIGVISNDCGGSSWYGEKILAAVYGELFKKEPQTLLTSLVFEALGIRDKDEYVDIVTERLYDDDLLSTASFNRLAFEAGSRGDEVALRILGESAAHYAGGIAYLASTMDFPSQKALHITLAGSVFTKEKLTVLPDLLARKVGERLPGHQAVFHILRTVPVAGAVSWAAHKAGFAIELDSIAEELSKAGL